MQEIITDRQVTETMRSVLEREEALSGQLQKAIFDPKMTRSKVKTVLENGQVPYSFYL